LTRRPYIARSNQVRSTDHLLTVDRCCLFGRMGSGKTVSTLTALDALYLTGETRPALVLAPKRVAQSVWPEEALKWDHLREITVSAIVGTEQERLAAIARDASVYTLNYENIPWFMDQFEGKPWPFATVIPDESTRLKNMRPSVQTSTTGKEFIRVAGGKRARQLARIAHAQVARWWNLTGTPTPNGLIDLWGQMWFVDQGQRLGRTFEGYKKRWFQQGFGEHSQPIPLPFAQEQIQDRLRDVCLTVDFDAKTEPLIVNTIYVDLPSKARALYRDMEKEMFMQIEQHEVEAFNAASRTMKCLQLANGAAYVDKDGHWKEVHNAKIDALESVIEEAAGMPVLVAYHFKSDLERLKRAFPKGRELDAKPQTIHDWNAGRIPILFAHPASAGHGLNLQDGGNILAVFGHWWDLEQYQQIVERIGPVRQAQSGHKRPVYIHHIVARDTVDELVMARRETKRAVQDLLLEAMRK
jgi:SNF2 family DNA or RNA helicase